jgi:hypothetical protein
MFWVESKQKTHCKNVDVIVWHTTSRMRDKKYLMHYTMSFDVFNNLVEDLSPL